MPAFRTNLPIAEVTYDSAYLVVGNDINPRAVDANITVLQVIRGWNNSVKIFPLTFRCFYAHNDVFPVLPLYYLLCLLYFICYRLFVTAACLPKNPYRYDKAVT